jgi:hypothetical protein
MRQLSYPDDKNTINPWSISFSCHKKVWIKCQEKDYHESYLVKCDNFIKGRGCPYCANIQGKIHPLDSLGRLLEEKGLLNIWSNKNKKSPFEYAPHSGLHVWWKCIDGKHKDYYRQIKLSNSRDFRCPECVQERDESFLQENVRVYLTNLGYEVLHEHNCTLKCTNPKTKYPLPYDNEVKELKLIIEVHGQQHYTLNSWHERIAKGHGTTPEYELHYQKLKDRYKRIYAKLHGYFYLEIPYTADDKQETWKQMIDDKIKEIVCK